MNRYKIIVEYDGGGYHGFQRQDNVRTIAGELEQAVYSLSQEEAVVLGSGRTDAGVHAFGQVVHFDLSKDFDENAIVEGLNYYLKKEKISIVSCEKVDEEFHARHSSKQRYYRYVVLNRLAKPALDLGKVWWVPRKLDVKLMKKASKYLIGEHDFSSFRAKGCQASSPVKKMKKISIQKVGDYIYFDFKANSYLYHMIRNVVGTFYYIGLGKWEVSYMKDILMAKDRSKAGVTAPPDGLYFMKVDY
jgi:tRNA pseudouridine38-40 synthase